MTGRLAKLWDRYRRTPKALRWVLWALVFLIGTWCAVDIDGRIRLERSMRQWEKQGINLRWHEILPQDIPEDEDLAAAPLIKEYIDAQLEHLPYYWAGGTTILETHTQLDEMADKLETFTQTEWQSPREAYGVQFGRLRPLYILAHVPEAKDDAVAREMLGHLTALEEELRLYAEAVRRPRSSPVEHRETLMEEGLIMHASYGHPIAIRPIELRAMSLLVVGESSAALPDIFTILEVARHQGAAHQKLEGQLVAQEAWIKRVLGFIWRGLEQHGWNEDELAQLEHALGKIQLLQDLPYSMQYELAFQTALLHDIDRKDRRRLATFTQFHWNFWGTTVPDELTRAAHRLIPKGIVCRWMEYCHRGTVEHLLRPGGIPFQELNVSHLDAFDAWASTASPPHTWLFTQKTFYFYSSALTRSLVNQQYIDLAHTAIALERYYLAHQVYPKDLRTLVPDYLPAVPMDRFLPTDPVIYDLRPNGRYRLAGVGSNRTYEGALPSKRDEDGDIVWQYEEVATPSPYP